MKIAESEWMLIAEAMELKQIAAQTIRAAAREGRIGSKKVGGIWMVRRADVLAYSKGQGGPGRPRPSRQGPRGEMTAEQRANVAAGQRARRAREKSLPKA